VGLAGYEDSPCYQLSAGQQRRAALARLFIAPIWLWILDEPFTAIDRHGVAELESWLAAHAEAGGAVLLTTHQPLALVRPSLKVALQAETRDA
jgi:heme exporter protein A